MFKLIIEQVESGYASYKAYLIWNSTRMCPQRLDETRYGKGIVVFRDPGDKYSDRFASFAEAEKAANEFSKAWLSAQKPKRIREISIKVLVRVDVHDEKTLGIEIAGYLEHAAEGSEPTEAQKAAINEIEKVEVGRY